jgi:hypothetical protein
MINAALTEMFLFLCCRLLDLSSYWPSEQAPRAIKALRRDRFAIERGINGTKIGVAHPIMGRMTIARSAVRAFGRAHIAPR